MWTYGHNVRLVIRARSGTFLSSTECVSECLHLAVDEGQRCEKDIRCACCWSPAAVPLTPAFTLQEFYLSLTKFKKFTYFVERNIKVKVNICI